MSLLSEVLIVSGVAMDLVGAVVLSHAHNAESIMEIREEVEGEEDEVATHAQLLSEKRIGFLFLAFGLSLYLAGLVLKSPEGAGTMAVAVVAAGITVSVFWTKLGGRRVREQIRDAKKDGDGESLPEQ